VTERIGLFGGTFDPPHVGHLAVAYAALEGLGLSALRLIPAAQQPLKPGGVAAPPHHRLAMTRLMAAADPRLVVDPIEIERGGLSFTVETVRAYRAAHPSAELVLLIGADVLGTLSQWREPEAIAAAARIVVVTRNEDEGPGGVQEPALAFERLATRRIDLSSTELRARVRAGLPIRGFVTDGVADYIAAHGLYRTT